MLRAHVADNNKVRLIDGLSIRCRTIEHRFVVAVDIKFRQSLLIAAFDAFEMISRGTVVTSAREMRMSMPCWRINSCTGRLLSRIEQRLITNGFYESTIR